MKQDWLVGCRKQRKFAATIRPKHHALAQARAIMLLSVFKRSAFLRPKALGKLAFINLRRDARIDRRSGRRYTS